jgi:hypothetical protein
MLTHAHPTPSSAAASNHGAALPSLELLEARRLRDSLKFLLRTEQAAMADFLVALADFDRRRGWEPLGHASLFAFLVVDLELTPAPTFWRQEAARLLQRFPDLEGPLRHGKLCLTTMAELAKVLTAENRDAVLPRFLGSSTREAKEIVAELQPREAPATRAVVTRLPGAALVSSTGAVTGLGRCDVEGSDAASVATSCMLTPPAAPDQPVLRPDAPLGAPLSQLWAPKVDFGGGVGSVAKRDEIEPLSADRSRIHVSVSRQFTRKLEAARRGLGHSIPNATMEQALEAALDLLLEKQARARGQVKRPRAILATATPTPSAGGAVGESRQDAHGAASAARPEGRAIRRDGPREPIPAAVRRAVWARDGGCCWPLDGGGRCGSTHRLQLDHIVPWAEWGGETEGNLQVVCAVHNRLAARQVFGARVMERYGKVREPVAQYAAANRPATAAA